jgi:hypothetical protein
MRPRSGEASLCENLHLTAAIIADLGWGRQARPKPLRGSSLDPRKRPSPLPVPGRWRSRIAALAVSCFRKPGALPILERRGLGRGSPAGPELIDGGFVGS